MRKRKCMICGEWYRPKVHNQKTCSKECSEELRKMTAKKCQREYYKNNREKVNAKRREWFKKHPEKRKEYEKKWWDKYYSNREQNIDDIFNAYYEYLDDCGIN